MTKISLNRFFHIFKISLFLVFFIPLVALAQQDEKEYIPVDLDELVETDDITEDEEESLDDNIFEAEHEEQELRNFSKNYLERLRNDDDYQYNTPKTTNSFKDFLFSILRDIFGNEVGRTIFDNFEYVYYTIAAIVLVVLIIYAFGMNPNFIFKRKIQEAEEEEVSYETVDIRDTKVDWEKLIQESEKNEKYKDAVHFLFLYLLKILSDEKIIKWTPEKTKDHFRREIKDKEIQHSFELLAHSYSYIWYGDFEIERNSFNELKTSYYNLYNKLKSTA